jgi:hypothetical protein
MARHSPPEAPPERGDRLLAAVVIVAGTAFIASVLWLLIGSR